MQQEFSSLRYTSGKSKLQSFLADGKASGRPESC